MSIQSKLVYGLGALILLCWIVGIIAGLWAERNQVVYGFGGLIVLCLVAGIIAALWEERELDKIKRGDPGSVPTLQEDIGVPGSNDRETAKVI